MESSPYWLAWVAEYDDLYSEVCDQRKYYIDQDSWHEVCPEGDVDMIDIKCIRSSQICCHENTRQDSLGRIYKCYLATNIVLSSTAFPSKDA
jgi:hypothetical protein